MALSMYLAVGMNVINIALLGVLLVVYVKNYMEMKAQFSLGLILFAGTLVLNKLLTIFFIVITMMDHADELGIPLLILETLQLFAFSILTYLTLK
ncbi:MAG: hypothetical protein ACW97V_20190 [Promethearchaeota archaeon]